MSSNDKVRVAIPEPLRDLAEGSRTIEVDPGSVTDILVEIAGDYPEIGPALINEQGQLAEATVVAIDGHDIARMEGLNTPVEAGQTMAIVTARPV